MGIEKTVSELAEILGVSRQAMNNRVKSLPDEFVEKNDKGVTVVNRQGLVKLEEIYKTTIFEDEPVSDEVLHREMIEIVIDGKNEEIERLYAQLKVKDIQIAEKDKQLDQQQQLTAKAMADKEVLKLELDEVKAQAEEVKPKGFFARLFGK